MEKISDLDGRESELAVRLGLAPIRGIGEKVAERVVVERAKAPFDGVADLARRVWLSTTQLEALATAGALVDLGADRRQGLWLAGALAAESGTAHQGGYKRAAAVDSHWTDVPDLPAMDEVTTAVADVWATGVSPPSFPTQFRQADLHERGVLRIADIPAAPAGQRVYVAGVVTHRQRPGTARGVTFLSLEDETGLLNVICSPGLWQRYRTIARGSAALVVRGWWRKPTR